MPIARQQLLVEDPADFGRLGGALDALDSDGHLRDVNATDAEDPRRIVISRTYLVLLGYLRDDNHKDRVDSELQDAVRGFQAEVGREATGAVDDGTWRDLVELAQFDSDTRVATWFDGGEPSPALVRATRLRLFAYGLLADKPDHKRTTGSKLAKAQRALDAALHDFVRVASLLGLSAAPLDATLDVPTLTLLFDHHRLLRGLRPHPGGKGFAVAADHPRFPIDRTRRHRLCLRFIKNLAVVEVWLLGYAVRPGNFKPDASHGREADDSLNGALTEFARDRAIERPGGKKPSLGMWFFEEVQRVEAQGDETDAVDDELLDKIVRDRKSVRDLEKSYKSLGARIADGVRRAVGWVATLVRKAWRAVKSVLRNLARVLNQAAFAAYQRLRAVVRAVAEGFEYFFSSVVKGSDPDAVSIHKLADFDMDVVIHPATPDGRILQFFSALAKRVKIMRVGGHIIVEFFEFVSIVVTAATAAAVWLTLVLALVRLGKWLRRVGPLVEEAFRLITELEELEALEAPP